MAQSEGKRWGELNNSEWVQVNLEKKRRKKRGQPDEPVSEIFNLPLPPDFEAEINKKFPACEKLLCMRKILTESDVSKKQARLNMLCHELETFRFLNDEETGDLRQGKGTEVPVMHKSITRGVKESPMSFFQRDVRKDSHPPERVSSSYVFTKGWNSLVSEDGLKKGDVIQCWAFRDGEKLVGMALVKEDRSVNLASSHHHAW
ncbi:B3 domain-containing protein At2g31420-like [Neltuma alba]|uniref:B3 domain-containing protein At2g31420-like n=1 Tax=Neltuma alba TaxID=207710 RepID=UPI0010A2AA44|nr:B3 domain-containing protein At2g31420-like [Prosopis alba]